MDGLVPGELPLRLKHSFAICFVASTRASILLAVRRGDCGREGRSSHKTRSNRRLAQPILHRRKRNTPSICGRSLRQSLADGREHLSTLGRTDGFSVIFNCSSFLLNITTCSHVAMCWGQPPVGLRLPSGCPQHVTNLRQLAQSDLMALAFK
jgi:hypothetical protein